MNGASEPQEARHTGGALSPEPFTTLPAPDSAPRVITNQHDPSGLHSSENVLPPPTGPCSQRQRPVGQRRRAESWSILSLQVDSPPTKKRKFARCFIPGFAGHLRRKGVPASPQDSEMLRLRSPKSCIAQKLPTCDKGGTSTVGVLVKLQDQHAALGVTCALTVARSGPEGPLLCGRSSPP